MKNRLLRLVLSLVIVLSVLSGLLCNSSAVEAATQSKQYYIVFDNTNEVPLTELQYSQLVDVWNKASAEDILHILKNMLGENAVPQSVTRLTLRVKTNTNNDESGSNPTSAPSSVPDTISSASDPNFLMSGNTLIQYVGSDQIVKIPDNVVNISKGAFRYSSKVKKIVVPSSVRTIDQIAFYKCPKLQYIVFAGKATSVSENMIYQCESLKNVVAPVNSKEYKYAIKEGIVVMSSDRPQFAIKTLYMLVGDSQKIILYNNLNTVKWISSKVSVATVSSAGKIKCRKTGTAKITAKTNGKNYSLLVKVSGKSEDKRVRLIIKTVIKKGMSSREKIKAVHNWMIKNVKYDYYNYQSGTVPAVSHTAKGALLRGVAVCDGYSKAFKKVMDKLKIPCKIMYGSSQGGGHAWNLVKVGKKWLHVDVTFDDPIINGSASNTKPWYSYFLKSSKQMRKSHSW